MKNQSAKGVDVVSVAGAIELGKERGVAIASDVKANSCHEIHSGLAIAQLVIVNVTLQIPFPEETIEWAWSKTCIQLADNEATLILTGR